MRLAAYTDYGLRVLMRLAGTPDAAVPTGQIAEEFAISQHHLAKVVRDLGRGGSCSRSAAGQVGCGWGGRHKKITLGEVVRHLEQRFAIVECFRADGGNCLLKPRCRLKPQLAAAQEAFLSELERTTIADCAWLGEGPDRGLIAAA